VKWTKLVLTGGSGYLSEAAYSSILAVDRPTIQRLYATQVFAHADALIFLTTLCAAPLISEQRHFSIGQITVSDTFLSHNTYPASCAGLPKSTVPMGLLASRMPMGIDIDASYGNDLKLLGLAQRIERVWGSFRHRPVCSACKCAVEFAHK
jgi:mandelamide amidase